MRTLILLLLVSTCAVSTTKSGLIADQAPDSTAQVSYYFNSGFCDESKDITTEYRMAMYEISLELYKKILERANMHFVFSPFSVWRTLAALAEGADPVVQQQLFKFLHLPKDPCTRQKYYQKMGQRIQPGDDIKIASSQTLVIDDNVKLNPDWLSFVFKHSLLSVALSPIKTYPPMAANYVRQLISAPLSRLNLNGNSVILDSIDYSGLWTTAFSDKVVQRAPFYDITGQKIGSVDLMVMKKKVRMTYVPEMGMKLLELPTGLDGRYSLLFGLVNTNANSLVTALDNFTTSLVIEMLGRLKESLIPLEIAIPRFKFSSSIDMRNILEDLGLTHLWTNPAMTRYVSEPAALPRSYLQHATIALDVQGLAPTPRFLEPSYNSSTGLDPELGRDFIADRPFLFALMDRETYSCILTAAYAQPTYDY